MIPEAQEIVTKTFNVLMNYGESGAVKVALEAIESLKKAIDRKPVKVIPLDQDKILKIQEHPLTQQQISDIIQAGDIIANLPVKNHIERSQLKAAGNAIQKTVTRLNPKDVFCILDPNTGEYIKEEKVTKEQAEIEVLKKQIEELKELNKLKNEREALKPLAEEKQSVSTKKDSGVTGVATKKD